MPRKKIRSKKWFGKEKEKREIWEKYRKGKKIASDREPQKRKPTEADIRQAMKTIGTGQTKYFAKAKSTAKAKSMWEKARKNGK